MMDDISIANYADDNAPFVSGDAPLNVIKSLENAAEKLFEWFANNHMNANHDKCHLLLSTLTPISIKIRLYNEKGISKTPTRKIPTHQNPLWKIPTRKIPTQKTPTWNIATHVFKHSHSSF